MALALNCSPKANACARAAAVGIASLLVDGYFNSKVLDVSPLAFWIGELVIWVVLPIGLLQYLNRAGVRFTDLGFSQTIFGRCSASFVALVSVLFVPIAYLGFSVPYAILAFPDDGIFQYHSMIPKAGPGAALVPIYFALTAGIVEEIYFRGLLYNIASIVRRPALIYLVVSPALFAAIHWESGLRNTVTTYIWGWLMACAFLLMRNLWPLVVAHVCTAWLLFAQSAAP